jgi:hypothetical protein
VQDALERKSGMITDLHNTLITRTDLGKMCTKELVGWIGSKGFSARSYVIQKKSQTLYVLNIAEKVWDFLSADISDRHLCVRFGLKMNRTSTYDEVGLARKTPYALLAKDTFKPPEGQRLSLVEPQNHLLMHQFPDDHQYTSGPSEEEIPSRFQEEHQQPQHGLRGLTNSAPEKLQENRLFSVGISIPEAIGAFDKTSRVSESLIKALQKSSQLSSNESKIKNFKLKNPEVRSQLNRMSTH